MDIKPVKKPVTIGVVGYGHYLRTNLVLHLLKCSSLKIIGVYNRGEERRKQAEEDGFWATSDYNELLARKDMEAVLIGTANAAHKEQAILAAKAGKHVLCEKPLALHIKDIDQMVAAVEKARVVNHVNHPGPYAIPFMKFREIVANEAGEVMHFWRKGTRAFGTWIQGARHTAVAHPEESGGWTFHHYCHHLNEACIILNSSKATKVYHLEQKSCPQAPSEELASSLLTFDSGATAFIADGTTIGPFTDMGVHGSKADVRLLNDTIYVMKPGKTNKFDRPGNVGGVMKTYNVKDDYVKLQQRVGHVFAQAVRGGEDLTLSFRFIRNQYRILGALKDSAGKGKSVELKW